MQKICIITTTQPAANPRVVKEANSFFAAGYDVTVLYNYVTDWAQNRDTDILSASGWKYLQVGGTSKKSIYYRRDRIMLNIYGRLNKMSGGRLYAERAHARCYNSLMKEAIRVKADWYIGHNPGAMAIAANAAKKNKAKAGFDFEDYHRGEYSNAITADAKRQVFLECRYVSCFDYISAASPMITQKIENDFPHLGNSIITLLNCFPLHDQVPFRTEGNDNLNLLWFSQHIGEGRGLESVIIGLKKLNDPKIHISLVGNCSENMKDLLLTLAGNMSNNIRFTDVIAPSELVRFASRFDIGLATEIQEPLNRDICLTNKIFTYLLAGNAVIFSNTSMQEDFNKDYRVGESYAVNNSNEFMTAILKYKDRGMLDEQRNSNYNLAASTLNWEKESVKLLNKISSLNN